MKHKVQIQIDTTQQLIDYQYALDYMKTLVNEIINNNAPSTIWFLEHPSIYTAGLMAEDEELFDKTLLPVYNVDRGGRYTYHGPGQRIIYFMINLKHMYMEIYKNKPDIRHFVKSIENIIIDTLSEFSIIANIHDKFTGVWVNCNKEHNIVTTQEKQPSIKKIAAIGLKVQKWVSYHGIAININPDLHYYDNIIPCGIRDNEYGITSMIESGFKGTITNFDSVFIQKLQKYFIY